MIQLYYDIPNIIGTSDFLVKFIFSGKLKPASAFLTGKLKISGNLNKAMKLEKLMGVLKSKL